MTDPATTRRPSAEDLRAQSASLETGSPQDVLAYACSAFRGRIILACSFGAEDVVLVDMIQRLAPDTPLFYLDTDFLFPETHDVKQRIIAKYGLPPERVIQVKSALTPEEQATQYGAMLWIREPDRCCYLRKVQPLGRILKGYDAWVTGIRRAQSPTRANAGLLEWDAKFGLVKVNPLATWTDEDVWAYIRAHDVPYNALHDRHYPSIGCTHCTGPVLPGQDPRSGRWRDFAKTECGLHTKS